MRMKTEDATMNSDTWVNPMLDAVDGEQLDEEEAVQGTGGKDVGQIIAVPESVKLASAQDMSEAVAQWRESLVVHSGLRKENERDRRKKRAIQKLTRGNIINPASGFRKRWDLVQIIFLVYVAMGVPYRLGFQVEVRLWSPAFWFDLVVDIYFVVDIFISLRTAFYDDTGDLIASKRSIRQNYMWQAPYWFWIDIMACFPGNYIAWAIDDGSGQSAGGRSNKLIRMLRMLRLLKLLRLARFNRIMQRYEEELYALLTSLKLFKVILIMAAVGHWLACLWYWSGTDDEGTEQCMQDDGTYEKCVGWVDRKWGNGTSYRTAEEPTSETTRYMTAMYWSVMTMTTVGYGDITPSTATEFVMAIIGMVIGGFMFGLIVGNLAELSKRSNAAELIRQKNLVRVMALLHCNACTGVPADVIKRVRNYYATFYQHRTAMDFYSFIIGLPPSLRDELAAQMHWIDGESENQEVFGQLHKVPFFANLDTVSTIYICAKMKTIVATPLDTLEDGTKVNYIMQEGTIGQEMFLITDGDGVVLESTNAAGQAEQIGSLGTGDFFGELAALFPPGTWKDKDGKQLMGRVRTRSAYASKLDVVLGVLSYEDLAALKRDRFQIGVAMAPFCNAIAGALEEDDPSLKPIARMSPLECFPELQYLNSRVEERMDQIEAMLDKLLKK